MTTPANVEAAEKGLPILSHTTGPPLKHYIFILTLQEENLQVQRTRQASNQETSATAKHNSADTGSDKRASHNSSKTTGLFTKW
jgi:hypothetical protein